MLIFYYCFYFLSLRFEGNLKKKTLIKGRRYQRRLFYLLELIYKKKGFKTTTAFMC